MNNIYYGSFGCGHPFGATSVKILAPNNEHARTAMFKTFGGKFCSVYEKDYEDSEFFQKPIMTLEVIIYPYYDELDVKCIALHPENLFGKQEPEALPHPNLKINTINVLYTKEDGESDTCKVQDFTNVQETGMVISTTIFASPHITTAEQARHYGMKMLKIQTPATYYEAKRANS